jgi:hypothetical protein
VQSEETDEGQASAVRPLRIPRTPRETAPAPPPSKKQIAAELRSAQEHQLSIAKRMDMHQRALDNLEDEYERTQRDISQMQRLLVARDV